MIDLKEYATCKDIADYLGLNVNGITNNKHYNFLKLQGKKFIEIKSVEDRRKITIDRSKINNLDGLIPLSVFCNLISYNLNNFNVKMYHKKINAFKKKHKILGRIVRFENNDMLFIRLPKKFYDLYNKNKVFYKIGKEECESDFDGVLDIDGFKIGYY